MGGFYRGLFSRRVPKENRYQGSNPDYLKAKRLGIYDQPPRDATARRMLAHFKRQSTEGQQPQVERYVRGLASESRRLGREAQRLQKKSRKKVRGL